MRRGTVTPNEGGSIRRTTAGQHEHYGSEHRPLIDRRGVGIGSRIAHGERGSRPIGQHVQLGAGFAAVDRARPVHIAPFVALTLAASITARWSAGWVPPPCGRGLNRGSNGSTRSHNFSGTNRIDNAPDTTEYHAAQPNFEPDMPVTCRGGSSSDTCAEPCGPGRVL
jgi:hypothetical protein